MGMRINGVQDSFVVVSYDFEYTTEVSLIRKEVSERFLIRIERLKHKSDLQ